MIHRPPLWAGVAVRLDGGVLLTMQLSPVWEGEIDMSRDYDDVRSFGLSTPTRRIYQPAEVRITLHGMITDDSHWNRWRGQPAPAGDLPPAVHELPAKRREIER